MPGVGSNPATPLPVHAFRYEVDTVMDSFQHRNYDAGADTPSILPATESAE